MSSTIHDTMIRRNSNESEDRVNPNDPVSYTSQYAPHNTSAETATSNLPQASQHQAPAQSTSNNNTGILASATETAKQYLPETVVGALKNVGVIEKDTSVGDATSLPSTETKFGASRGGVGTLPGSISEASVAKLPEEKKLQEQVGHELGREGVLGTDAEEKPVGLMDVIADAKRNNVDTGIDTATKFINLDILPTPAGTPGEGTALRHAVPDNRPSESKTEATPLNNGPAHMQSEPSKEMEKAVNKPLPPAGGNTNDFNSTPANKDSTPADDKTYTEDQAKRKVVQTEPNNAHSVDEPKHEQGVERKEEVKSEEHGDATSETPSKSGKVPFAQKLKGEVKIISGKLSSNKAKVEEGQALKKGLDTLL